MAMMKKVYSSLSQLLDDLDQFIIYYNFKKNKSRVQAKGQDSLPEVL